MTDKLCKHVILASGDDGAPDPNPERRYFGRFVTADDCEPEGHLRQNRKGPAGIMTKGVVVVRAGADIEEGQLVSYDDSGAVVPVELEIAQRTERRVWGPAPVTVRAKALIRLDMGDGSGGPHFTVIRSWFDGPTPKRRATRRQRQERERLHERNFAQHLLNKAKERRRIEHWSRVSTSLFGKYPEERNQDTVDALGYAWRTMFERSKTSP